MTEHFTWYDAYQKDIDTNYLKNIIETRKGKELLAINITYGRVIELDDVVIVIHEEGTDGTSNITVIPKETKI